MTSDVVLYVCTTCRIRRDCAEGEASDGAQLLRALRDAQAADAPFALVGVECLSNCSRGCSVALAGRGRWTYVYGDIDPRNAVADILDGAARYASTRDGLVPWRERPAIFRKGVVARVPPLQAG